MITIDGSYGEGGGQIIRYSVALSALTQKPINVKNIRANRPNPGIRPQHFSTISIISKLCNAKVEGIFIDSKELVFIPNRIEPKKFKFDIETAGSIPLVSQAIILSMIESHDPITVELMGGTDVKWSPTWDYFVNVFLEYLQKMGFRFDFNLIKRGYYPKGGGKIILTIYPPDRFSTLDIKDTKSFKEIKGNITISNLPDHIAKRMKHTVMKIALKNNISTNINIEQNHSDSPGAGITLWTNSDDTILGSSIIGEKGVPSETIAKNAIDLLLSDIKYNVDFDIYAFDQLLPYFILSEEKFICKIREISNHAKTNLWLLSKFFDCNYKVKNDNQIIRFSVN